MGAIACGVGEEGTVQLRVHGGFGDELVGGRGVGSNPPGRRGEGLYECPGFRRDWKGKGGGIWAEGHRQAFGWFGAWSGGGGDGSFGSWPIQLVFRLPWGWNEHGANRREGGGEDGNGFGVDGVGLGKFVRLGRLHEKDGRWGGGVVVPDVVEEVGLDGLMDGMGMGLGGKIRDRDAALAQEVAVFGGRGPWEHGHGGTEGTGGGLGDWGGDGVLVDGGGESFEQALERGGGGGGSGEDEARARWGGEVRAAEARGPEVSEEISDWDGALQLGWNAEEEVREVGWGHAGVGGDIVRTGDGPEGMIRKFLGVRN